MFWDKKSGLPCTENPFFGGSLLLQGCSESESESSFSSSRPFYPRKNEGKKREKIWEIGPKIGSTITTQLILAEQEEK